MHVHGRRAPARRILTTTTIAILALALALPTASAAPKTKLISQSTAGEQATMETDEFDIDGSGNAVVFATAAKLSPSDTNGAWDIYRRNVSKKKTTLVSRAHGGGPGDGPSGIPRLSTSGRYVAFSSRAANLTKKTVDAGVQVYRRDLATGTTRLVSKGARGVADEPCYRPGISYTGRYIVFQSAATNLTRKKTHGRLQTYLRDLKTGKTYLVSQNTKGRAGRGGDSFWAVVSADGRFVVFTSQATNLSAKVSDGTHVYLRDRGAGKTMLISQHPGKGKPGNDSSYGSSISADGRYIVFQSFAENLIKWHRDDNGRPDIYRYDRVKKTMRRISVDWKGRQLAGSSGQADISADGKVITFSSSAPDVIRGGNVGDWHVYRRGRLPGSVKMVDRNNDGVPANGVPGWSAVSAHGRYVAYETSATNLTGRPDVNGDEYDVFRTGPF